MLKFVIFLSTKVNHGFLLHINQDLWKFLNEFRQNDMVWWALALALLGLFPFCALLLPFLNPIFGCFLNFGLQKGFPLVLSFYGPEGIFLTRLLNKRVKSKQIFTTVMTFVDLQLLLFSLWKISTKKVLQRLSISEFHGLSPLS